tara:strand:- start:794 stop:2098 length:1305 start_codon:yes stop_codon:yes gene_type:complete
MSRFYQTIYRDNKNKFIYYFLFLYPFFKPDSPSLFGKMGVRLIDFSVLLLFLIPIIYSSRKKIIPYYLNLPILFSFTYLIVNLLSWSSHLGSHSSFLDIPELMRPLLYGSFLIGANSYLMSINNPVKFIVKNLSIVYLINLVITLIGVFYRRLAYILVYLHTSDKQLPKIISMGRQVGFFGNPNTFGISISIISIILYHFCNNNRVRIFILISTTFMLLNSASLAGLFSFFIALIIYSYENILTEVKRLLIKFKIRKISIFLIITLCFSFFLSLKAINNINFSQLRYINNKVGIIQNTVVNLNNSNNISELVNENCNDGITCRIFKIKYAIDDFSSNPLLGIGPAREIRGSSIDNIYLYVLQRYGIVGSITCISFLSLIVYKLKNILFISIISIPILSGISVDTFIIPDVVYLLAYSFLLVNYSNHTLWVDQST